MIRGHTSQEVKGASFSSSRSRFMVSVRRRALASRSKTLTVTFCPSLGRPLCEPAPVTCCAGTRPLRDAPNLSGTV